MNVHQKQVRQFMLATNEESTINKAPGYPSDKIVKLARELIYEEYAELDDSTHRSLAGIAKELADLLYVTYWMANAYGIDMEPIFDEVHNNNMTKVSGPRRDDGKIMKPDDYVPVNLAPLLLDQLASGNVFVDE